MNSVAELGGPFLERLQRLAQVRAQNKPQRIAEGVERWGWDPQADCDVCGDTGIWQPQGADCSCPAGVRRAVERSEAAAAEQLERDWEASGVPRRFQGFRLAGSPVAWEQIQIVNQWLEGRPEATGTNLLITGTVGSGKTGMAVAALRVLLERGAGSVVFTAITYLLDAIRPHGADEGMLRRCQTASVLVLDDLGTTRGKEWEQERIFALLDYRHGEQMPTIVTTNIAIGQLTDNLGERSVSRLLGQIVIVSVDGEDQRLLT